MKTFAEIWKIFSSVAIGIYAIGTISVLGLLMVEGYTGHAVIDLRADEAWWTATLGVYVVAFLFPLITLASIAVIASIKDIKKGLALFATFLFMVSTLIIMGNTVLIFVVQAVLPLLIGSEWILYAGFASVTLLILNTIFYKKESKFFYRLTIILPAGIIIFGLILAGLNFVSSGYTVISYEQLRIKALMQRNVANELKARELRVSAVVRHCNIKLYGDIAKLSETDNSAACQDALDMLESDDVVTVKKATEEKRRKDRKAGLFGKLFSSKSDVLDHAYIGFDMANSVSIDHFGLQKYILFLEGATKIRIEASGCYNRPFAKENSWRTFYIADGSWRGFTDPETVSNSPWTPEKAVNKSSLPDQHYPFGVMLISINGAIYKNGTEIDLRDLIVKDRNELPIYIIVNHYPSAHGDNNRCGVGTGGRPQFIVTKIS